MTVTAMTPAYRSERPRPSVSPVSLACVASALCVSRLVAVLRAMALMLVSAPHLQGVRNRLLWPAPATLSSTA